MLLGVNPEACQTREIKILNIVRRRLQHDLILIIMLQAIRVFAIATIGRTSAWLRIAGSPRLRPQRPQEGRRMEGAGAHFNVIGLMDDAAFVGPKTMKGENELLKGHRIIP
jgi:hypothetical protein